MDELSNIRFVTDEDVVLKKQYEYEGSSDNFYVYKNKINGNLTYFSKKLIDLNNIEQYTIYY